MRNCCALGSAVRSPTGSYARVPLSLLCFPDVVFFQSFCFFSLVSFSSKSLSSSSSPSISHTWKSLCVFGFISMYKYICVCAQGSASRPFLAYARPKTTTTNEQNQQTQNKQLLLLLLLRLRRLTARNLLPPSLGLLQHIISNHPHLLLRQLRRRDITILSRA